MWKIAAWLGNVAGALSLALLFKQGFSAGFAAPLRTVLEYYESFVQFLLGWAHPILAFTVDFLERASGYNPPGALDPNWKHIYVAFAVPATAAWRAMAKELSQGDRAQRFWRLLDAMIAEYLALLFVLMILAVFSALLASPPGPDTRQWDPYFVFAVCLGIGCLFVMLIPISGWMMSILSGDREGEADATVLMRPIATNLVAMVGGGILFVVLNAGLKLAGL